MKTKFFLTGIAIFAIVAIGSAQTDVNNSKSEPVAKCGTFVDNNNDGVCDNYVSGKKCDGQGQGKAYRNGKGKCQQSGLKNGNGNGNGKCNQNRQGQYVDANNNGVCDKRE